MLSARDSFRVRDFPAGSLQWLICPNRTYTGAKQNVKHVWAGSRGRAGSAQRSYDQIFRFSV